MPYAQALQTVLFPALGLRNTWVTIPARAMNTYAWGYDRKTDKPIRMAPGVLDAEAYGVKSSARDMLTLLDAELGTRKISPDLTAAIGRTREGQFRTADFVQDMIWEQYPWPVGLDTILAGNDTDFIMRPHPEDRLVPTLPPQKDVILDKTGSTNGFGTYIALLPGEGIGIVVLANRNYPNATRVRATLALVQALLDEKPR
jgi:beta-lactamase class C